MQLLRTETMQLRNCFCTKMHICKFALVARSANMQICSFCRQQMCTFAFVSRKNACKYTFFCKATANMQIRVAGAKREYANMQLLRTMSRQTRACFSKNNEYANICFLQRNCEYAAFENREYANTQLLFFKNAYMQICR